MDASVTHGGPFPDTARVVYRRTPLVEVICQLRFPTILEIAAKDPADFQERIRSDYPIYAESENVPSEIKDILSRLPIGVTLDTRTHKFGTEDGNRFVSLARDFIAVSAHDYSRWESFLNEITRAKSAVEDVYQPTFYSRVGLRYRDVIDKDALGLGAARWDELITPALIGLLGASGVREFVREIQGEAAVDLGRIVSGSQVRIRHGLTINDQTQVYLIDVDCFRPKRSESSDVIEFLNGFNRVAGNLFRWAITKRLADALEPTELH